MEQKEIWRTISEYPSYEVSNLGRIRTKKTGRIRKTVINKNNGYEMVMFYDDSVKAHNLYVHRLVCAAFLPNPNGYTDVDHQDGNRANNVITNLRFMPHAENMRGRGKYCSFRGRKVVQKDLKTGVSIRIWNDYVEAGNANGVRPNRIGKILDPSRNNKSIGGYTYEFLD